MDWETLMKQEFEKGVLGPVRDRLEKAYQTTTVYPPRNSLFRALEMTPFDQVKVVILGQDPYHGPNQAQGFSFSVPETEKIPPSLVNIYKEISQEYGKPVQRSGDLSDWAAQGVLLLNTILSVEQGKPLSHADFGWQAFTDDILKALNEARQPIVFLLWGAQAKAARRFLTNPDHLVLESAHPSPLAAHKGFFGNNHFRQANDYLQAHGLQPIAWAEDNRQRA